MAIISQVTTSEQTVSATGAITGSLDTSALTGDFTIRGRVRAATGNPTVRIAIEDTANATPFSEALQVSVKDVKVTNGSDGETVDFGRSYDLPSIRFGATNTKLRANCQAITGGTAFVEVWIEQ